MYKPDNVTQILKDLRSSVKAELTDANPWVFPNNLVPLLKAIAQGFRSLYLRLQFVHEQAFVVLAQGEYLDFHGIQSGGLSRNPASYAQGVIDVTAPPGTVVGDSVVVARSDGFQFVTIGTNTLVDSPMGVLVRGAEPGALGNTDAGAPLAFNPSITGVTLVEVGDAGIVGGVDEESDDSFRQRILYYRQNPPHGGSPAEYAEWAQTKPGVTRVFPMRATPQPGSVTIYFMMDGIGTGIPTAGDVSELQGILDQLAPAEAEVIVAAPVAETLDITITNIKPNTGVVRNRVVEELKAQFLRRAEPASATTPFVFYKAWLTEAVAGAQGWKSSTITVPAGDTTVSTAGHILQLGTVTFA